MFSHGRIDLLINSWILLLYILIPGVQGDNNDISWSSVGIAWLLCTITTIIIIGIMLCVRRYVKRRAKSKLLKLQPPKRHGYDSQRSTKSASSANTRVTILSSTSSDPFNRNSCLSNDSGPSNDMRRILPRSVSQDPERINRRKTGDFTSKWCTEHGLSEKTAQALRHNGFISESTLRSLRSEDVYSLGLASRAEECVLRQVLEDMYADKSIKPSGEQTRSKPKKSLKKRAASSSELTNANRSESSSQPDANTALLDRAYSETEFDDRELQQINDGTKTKSTAHSYDVIDGDKSGLFGAQSAIELQPGVNKPVFHYPDGKKTTNLKGFNGLLSDKGLHTLAREIGQEWQQLAALLNIPISIIQKIKLDNAHNTHQQICEMLRLFRDTASGSKEEIKGQLSVALESVHRRDIARQLLQEQVDGSLEKIPYHSIV